MGKYIFDLDGTLALIDHRRPILETDDPKRWDKFYEACVDDTPNVPVVEMFRKLVDEDEVFIFSGRSESVRPETIMWLMDNVFPSEWSMKAVLHFSSFKLFMRPIGNSVPDEELKLMWFNAYFPHRSVVVFDDRQKVVDMWRKNGVTCFQVAPGNF